MKEKLSWGVVGTGGIATDFANALTKSKRCKIVNVTGLTPELSKAFADRWRIPATAASIDELLADNAVAVSSAPCGPTTPLAANAVGSANGTPSAMPAIKRANDVT